MDNNFFKKLSEKIRYGLIFQSFRNRLAKIGLDLRPYYLMHERIEFVRHVKIKDCNHREYKFVKLNEQDFEYIGNNAPGYPYLTMTGLLNQGRECFGIKHNGEVAAFIWVDYKKITYLPVEIMLEKDEAYISDVFTMEKYRRRNIASYMFCKCMEELSGSGIVKFYSITEYLNLSASRYKKKLNAKKVVLGINIKLLNKFTFGIRLRDYQDKLDDHRKMSI